MPRQLSHGAIRDLLGTALNQTTGGGAFAYVRDVFPASVVYDLEPSGPGPGKVQTLQRAYSIDAKTLAVTLGDAEPVQEVRTWEPVSPAAFSLDDAPALQGAFVVRRGIVFRTGDYPDKDFSMDWAEADAEISRLKTAPFAASFADEGLVPNGFVPNDLEHRPTVFSRPGKRLLGHATITHRDGDALFGEVHIPAALADLIGDDEPLKVSATFDRATKRLVGMALCLNPRIEDAAVFAAFSEDAPTVPEKPRKGTPMKTEKPSLIQRVLAKFSGASEAELEEILKDEDQPETPKPDAEKTPTTPDPALAAAQAEVARLQALVDAKTDDQAATAQARVKDAATAFALDAITRGKAFPTEQEALEAAFTEFATGAGGVVGFTDGGDVADTPGLKTFKASVEARVTRDFSAELLTGGSKALFAMNGAVPPTKAAPGPIDTAGVYARINGQENK